VDLGEVTVFHGGLDVPMAHQLLHSSDIDALHDQLRCKGVSHVMKVEIVDPRLLDSILEPVSKVAHDVFRGVSVRQHELVVARNFPQ
jgi:hypothetical protein